MKITNYLSLYLCQYFSSRFDGGRQGCTYDSGFTRGDASRERGEGRRDDVVHVDDADILQQLRAFQVHHRWILGAQIHIGYIMVH